MALLPFLEQFPDDEACLKHLEAIRWPKGVVCPHCSSVDQSTNLPRPRYWQCRECRQQFTALHGTPLEGTHIPLRAWFAAIFLVAASSKGISGITLAREIGVSYKTAWFLGHRIRRMMEDDDPMLRGVVEVDETYLGGKRRKKGQKSRRDPDDQQPTGRGGSRKAVVTVAVERGGKAKARRAGTHSGRTLARFVWDNISPDAVLMTDVPAYHWIGRKFRAHLAVNHSRGEWVRRDPLAMAPACVNTAESVTAAIKRKWIGVHHWWSIKHTNRYLTEVGFRWNCQRLDQLLGAATGRLRFRDLTAWAG